MFLCSIVQMNSTASTPVIWLPWILHRWTEVTTPTTTAAGPYLRVLPRITSLSSVPFHQVDVSTSHHHQGNNYSKHLAIFYTSHHGPLGVFLPKSAHASNLFRSKDLLYSMYVYCFSCTLTYVRYFIKFMIIYSLFMNFFFHLVYNCILNIGCWIIIN